MKRTTCLSRLLVAGGLIAGGLMVFVGSACAPTHDHAAEETEEAEGESWAATAWGEHFEIFAETDGLSVGVSSLAFTHVTSLDDFSPLVEGAVSVILVDASGSEAVFSKDAPTRAGIFSIEVTPGAAGEFDLVFRVETPTRREEIPAGRVRVGEGSSSGGLVEPASVTAAAESAAGGAEISFLKEQQWRTDFATSWVLGGSLGESVRGSGRVQPSAGGEVLLTSPVDGVVSATPWPYPGHEVGRGAAVFRVTPRVASDRSLAELEADVAGLAGELDAARRRRQRLEGLHELGATSRREVEEAQAHLTTLEGVFGAATKDLATARSARQGGRVSSETVAVRTPFSGRVARVDTTPGQVVAAETPLGLIVRDRPLWVAVALRPEAASVVRAPQGLDLRLPNGETSLTLRGDRSRLVSVSPTLDPETGTVTALFEIDAGVDELPIGARVEAEILLDGEIAGVVIPETALVDDGGVVVVYLQLEGESFVRVEVEVLARQSGRALVDGLSPGVRLVERGGNAIRRATLVNQGVGDRHAH